MRMFQISTPMLNYKHEKTEQIILGIDPGYADMGYGLISRSCGRDRCLAYGSLRTAAGAPTGERLQDIHDGLVKLITEFHPDQAAVERLFFSRNAKTAIPVAEARGVILLCLTQQGVSCIEFSPAEVKMAVCGHGRADKTEMQKMVQILLRLEQLPRPDDAADALALALALASTNVPIMV